MIVDSSALLAIILDEAEAGRFAELILTTPQSLLPAAAYVEVSLKVDRGRDGVPNPALDATIAALGLQIADFSADQARAARAAYNRYGASNGGILNFGDCLVYATARHLNRPLLFKGNDFSRTDLTPALPAGAQP